eukprot:1690-Heterococcus_DN1.PRE.2
MRQSSNASCSRLTSTGCSLVSRPQRLEELASHLLRGAVGSGQTTAHDFHAWSSHLTALCTISPVNISLLFHAGPCGRQIGAYASLLFLEKSRRCKHRQLDGTYK